MKNNNKNLIILLLLPISCMVLIPSLVLVITNKNSHSIQVAIISLIAYMLMVTAGFFLYKRNQFKNNN